MTEGNLIDLLRQDDGSTSVGVVGSPSDTFEAIVDIRDISEKSKLLGELVYFTVTEGGDTIFVLGQITEIRTVNRWHEEPSFKGIIKRHGSLPNLSGIADNRIAKIGVQSSFKISTNTPEAHKLANSPSTGELVGKVSNEIMRGLVAHEKRLVCIGNAYDTDVAVPFWFKHFGESETGGAGDAYHIGVFGRTGSGKTTAAANILLGYARHSEEMSILILDPQEQFYEDNNVLPIDLKFKNEVQKTSMQYEKHKFPEEVSLPNNAGLFSKLLLNYGFIRKAFNIKTPEKLNLMTESVEEYISGRMNDPTFEIGENTSQLLSKMIQKFNENSGDNKYLNNVYAKGQYLNNLRLRVSTLADDLDQSSRQVWDDVLSLFDPHKKINLQSIVEKVVSESGHMIILNISGRGASQGMESIQMLFVKEIEDAIKQRGAERYAQGKQSNCLVVLDEAHRYMSKYSYDDTKDLSDSIIDAVRTTRKYGIGYMFITQTIESLHEEIRRQIRIFAFGYGLTSGSEFSKIKDTINDDAAAKFYRSFIDPASNKKYPFMFYGPISPLSFTGAPLFLEMREVISDFPINHPQGSMEDGN